MAEKFKPSDDPVLPLGLKRPSKPFNAADYEPKFQSAKKGGNFLTDTVHDVGIGTMRIPGAATGLVDIPLGLAGLDRPVSRAAESLGEVTGFQPGKWADEAQQRVYSPERQQADLNVQQAWDEYTKGNQSLGGAIKETLANPRNLAGNVFQSLPGMVAGGAAGKVLSGGSKIAGSLGEGLTTAGQQMDQVNSDSDPQKAALTSMAAGLGTGLIGYGGSKVANKLGIIDPDTLLSTGAGATAKQPLSIGKRIGYGAAQEGLFEELPQSMQEQAWQNVAEDKPITEGLAQAGVIGALAGGVMGGGFNIMQPQHETPTATNIPKGPLGSALQTVGINPNDRTNTAYPEQARSNGERNRTDVGAGEPPATPERQATGPYQGLGAAIGGGVNVGSNQAPIQAKTQEPAFSGVAQVQPTQGEFSQEVGNEHTTKNTDSATAYDVGSNAIQANQPTQEVTATGKKTTESTANANETRQEGLLNPTHITSEGVPVIATDTPNIWFDGQNEIEDNYAQPIREVQNANIPLRNTDADVQGSPRADSGTATGERRAERNALDGGNGVLGGRVGGNGDGQPASSYTVDRVALGGENVIQKTTSDNAAIQATGHVRENTKQKSKAILSDTNSVENNAEPSNSFALKQELLNRGMPEAKADILLKTINNAPQDIDKNRLAQGFAIDRTDKANSHPEWVQGIDFNREYQANEQFETSPSQEELQKNGNTAAASKKTARANAVKTPSDISSNAIEIGETNDQPSPIPTVQPNTPKPQPTDRPVYTEGDVKQIKEITKLANGPQIINQARAKVGGEVGPNGEFYKGGSFIATTDLPKRIKQKLNKQATGREQVEPGQGADKWSEIPAGKMPLMRVMGAGTAVNPWDGSINYEYLKYAKYTDDEIKTVESLRDKWLKGERFINVNDYPKLANIKDAARLAVNGHPIHTDLVGKFTKDVQEALLKTQEKNVKQPVQKAEAFTNDEQNVKPEPNKRKATPKEPIHDQSPNKAPQTPAAEKTVETTEKEWALIKNLEELDNFSSWTATHAENVGKITSEFARYFSDNPKFIATWEEAAVTHDEGKKQIPKSILDKPGRLTDEERATMSTHSELGAEALKQQDLSRLAQLAAQYHHNKFGRIPGLRLAENNLVQAVKIADIFESLTSKERAYRTPNTRGQALTIMLNDYGMFNGKLLQHFIDMQLRDHANDFNAEEKAEIKVLREKSMRATQPEGMHIAEGLITKWAKLLKIDPPTLAENAKEQGYSDSALHSNRIIRLDPSIYADLKADSAARNYKGVEALAKEFISHIATTELENSSKSIQKAVQADYDKANTNLSLHEWLAYNAARWLLNNEFNGNPKTHGLIKTIAEKIKTIWHRIERQFKVAPSVEVFLNGFLTGEHNKLLNKENGKPLYASRPVTNAKTIIAWAKAQGFKATLAPNDMHVTVAYSSKPMEGKNVAKTQPSLSVTGGKRTVEKLGDEGAVVLKFESPDMQSRWKEYRNAGASWDYESYTPHITITYKGDDVDLSKVKPFAGKIILGEEHQEDLNVNAEDYYKEETTQNKKPSSTKFGTETAKSEEGRVDDNNTTKTPDKLLNKAEPKAQPKQEEKAVEADEVKSEVTNQSIVDNHKDFFSRVRGGDVTAEQFKTEFEKLLSSKAEAIAELTKLTKAQLLDMGHIAYWHRNEDKKFFVDQTYKGLLLDFWISGETFSYNGTTDGMISRIRGGLEKLNDADIKDYSDAYQKAQAEKEAYKAEVEKGMENPQNLDDYLRVMKQRMSDGKTTFGEARMQFTPEQLAQFDEMLGEKTRGERKARADQQREVKATVTTTTGDIVETKHTKTGEALFVVKASERVERDTYNQWNATAKRLGGWYSSFRGAGAVPGFQFKTRDNAEAFLKYLGGDVEQAKQVAQERRDAYADDKSQSAVERLTEMADRLEEQADNSLAQDRKANTARRAGFAARAESAARYDKALAQTMRNIASAIDKGTAKFLDRVRQKVQVEMLQTFVNNAQGDKLRKLYPSYADEQKHQGEAPNAETADYAQFPTYTAFRSDLASLGRQLLETEGTKRLGQQLMKVADDTSDAYLKFAKDNIEKVASFIVRKGEEYSLSHKVIFPSALKADDAIARSGFRGTAVPIQIKRGQYVIGFSPSEALKRGVWKGDNDKRITLSKEFGAELVEKLGKLNRKKEVVRIPWQFDNAYDKQKRLAAMGIETPAELRAALREFIALREAPKAADKIKEMERAMIGRANDGLDFFPTPASTADEMIETADIKEGMSVLEPSAGMGHIAERIREAGVEPDVVEMSNSRKELLEAKGFNVVGRDFMELEGVSYDRIIMNPPFSDRRDIAHVQHAYDLLNPGGRLVAIMGEGAFFGSDKKAQSFREWLDEHNGTDEKLEEGTFKDPSLPVNTGVNARMVVIDKPEGDDLRYSKSKPSSGSTVEQIRSWLPNRVKRMADAGKLQIVQSVDDLPANLRVAGKSNEEALTSSRAAGISSAIKSSSVKTGLNNSSSEAKYPSNAIEIKTGLKQLNHFFDRVISFDSGTKQASGDKGTSKRGTADSKKISDILTSNAFIKHGFGGLDIPSRRMVLKIMRMAINDDKIGDGIIQSIPVDVMDFLGRQEFSPDVLFHDMPMLKDSNSLNAESSIPIMVNMAMSRVILSTAARGTKNISVKNLSLASGKRLSTNLANDLALHRSKIGSTSDGTERVGGFFNSAFSGIEFNTAHGTLNDRHDITPNSDVVLDKGDASTSSLSPIISRLSRVQGLYEQNQDVVYLVADMITKDSLNPVLFHELLHRSETTDPKVKAAISRFELDLSRRFNAASKGLGTPIEREAYRRVVAANVPMLNMDSEFRAYLISAYQREPQSFTGKLKKIFDDFVAAIRAFLVRNGLDMGFIKSLTPADLTALSKYGAAVESRSLNPRNETNPQFSVAPAQKSSLWNRWFGKSKMVSKGEPIKFYHGTNADFTVFDKSKLSPSTKHATAQLGHFFTRDKGEAYRYGNNVHEVFLSVQNPYVVTSELLDKRMGDDPAKFAAKLKERGFDGIWIRDAQYAIIFDSNQAKLTSNESPSFSNDIRFSIASPELLAEDLANFKQQAPEAVLNKLDSARSTVKKFGLSALTQRQLVELMSEILPMAKRFSQERNNYDTTESKWHQMGDEIAKRWETLAPGRDKVTWGTGAWRIWKKQNQKAQQALAEFLSDPMLEDIDPRKPEPERTKDNGIAIHNYRRLRAMYDALIPEAKQIVNDTDDFHRKVVEEYVKSVNSKITDSEMPEDKKTKLKEEIAEKFKTIKGIYAPWLRFGDYWVDSADGVEAFETKREQDKRIEEIRKEGKRINGYGKSFENFNTVQGVDTNFLGKVNELIDTLDVDKAAALKDGIFQLYLTALPEQSMRKRFIHRKGTPGYETDALRSFAKKSFHDGKQLAKLEFAPKMLQVLDDLEEVVKTGNSEKRYSNLVNTIRLIPEWLDLMENGVEYEKLENLYPKDEALFNRFNQFKDEKDRAKAMGDYFEHEKYILSQVEAYRDSGKKSETSTDIINALRTSYKNMMESNTNPLTNLINQSVFTYFLGFSPSSAIVNYLQTPGVALPLIAGRHGMVQSSKAMADAAQLFFGNKDKDGMHSIRPGLKDENEIKMFEKLTENGTFDRTRSHDLAGFSEEGIERGTLHRDFMLAATAWFHHAEVANREITALMAYRLEFAKTGNVQQSIEYANDVVNKAHLDYSGSNRPDLFHGNTARVMLQFKMYSQGMTWLWGKTAWDAMVSKDASPERKAEAKRILMSMIGVQSAMAGVLGLPIGGLLMAAQMLLNMMDDDDEPKDVEVEIQKGLNAVFGPLEDLTGVDVSRIVSRGALSETGADFHNRLSLADLWIREPDKELEGKDANYYLMKTILGPVAGIGENIFSGMKMIEDGDVQRGWETMLPNSIKGAAKAIRMLEEGGATSMQGNMIYETNAWEKALQSVGFRPSGLAVQQDQNQAIKNRELAIGYTKEKLINKAARYKMRGDNEAFQDTWEEIQRFNQKYPHLQINMGSIMRSIRSRNAASRNAEDGLVVRPKYQFVRDDEDFT